VEKLPDTLSVALKEWAVIVDAIGCGEQTVLLRKGGTRDASGFQPLHRDFLLYPTTEHQHAGALKPTYHPQIAALTEPNTTHVLFTLVGRVVDAQAIPNERALMALWDTHILSAEAVLERWRYKPERPLLLLVVRAFRLAVGIATPYRPQYAGCRSWVPLGVEITISGAAPVLDDQAFTAWHSRVRAALQAV
jgi:hypothetical protein